MFLLFAAVNQLVIQNDGGILDILLGNGYGNATGISVVVVLVTDQLIVYGVAAHVLGLGNLLAEILPRQPVVEFSVRGGTRRDQGLVCAVIGQGVSAGGGDNFGSGLGNGEFHTVHFKGIVTVGNRRYGGICTCIGGRCFGATIIRSVCALIFQLHDNLFRSHRLPTGGPGNASFDGFAIGDVLYGKHTLEFLGLYVCRDARLGEGIVLRPISRQSETGEDNGLPARILVLEVSFARDKGHIFRVLPEHTLQLAGVADLRQIVAVIGLVLHGGAGDGQGFGRNRHGHTLHVAVCRHLYEVALRVVPDGILPGISLAGQFFVEVIFWRLAFAGGRYSVAYLAEAASLTGGDQCPIFAVVGEIFHRLRMLVEPYLR